MPTLAEAACAILATADPAAKARISRDTAAAWRAGEIAEVGAAAPPERPARPARPELRRPGDMPRRRINSGTAGRTALLHALAHIELNAIDLAWDVVARFTGAAMPRAFYDDWVTVGDEEAKHHCLLADRLAALGAAYGDLPAHDGLWEAAHETRHDLLARLAVVPMVLEARGLDVTPAMIAKLHKAGDEDSAAALEVIYRDEIGHVAVGTRWFRFLCERRGVADLGAAWRGLVAHHFHGVLKPPFNDEARNAAGMTPETYTALAQRK